MATWPSASKAPTTNLDSGTDSPAAARADIKTNVDNVNSIIDMFNIDSPSNNQILKYNTSNSRFELAADADTDTNTTYAISAETATGGVNLRLTGSDASTDDVKLAEGSNITLTRTDANTITIAGSAGGISDVVADTTPQLGGNLDVNGNSIVSASNGNIAITPNGTGSIVLDGLNWPQADGSAGQVLKTNGSGQLSFVTAGGGGPTFALATAQSSLYTDGTNKNITWSEDYDGGSFLTINGTTGEFTLIAGSYILSLQGMGRIGGQGNGLEFRNVTNSTQIRDMGYNLAWDGGSTYMIPVGSFYLTPGSSNTYVFRFTGAPSSTSITSTVLNLVIRKVA